MPKAVITEEALPEEESVPEEDKIEEAPEEEVTETQDSDDEDYEEDVAIENLDPDEELWEGGPTAGQAIEWKNQFGKLFVTSIDYDEHILWRPILRSEYKNHVRTLERMTASGKVSQVEANLMNEELLAETCMLWPTYDPNVESLAGVPSIISQEIMEASGFVALQVREL